MGRWRWRRQHQINFKHSILTYKALCSLLGRDIHMVVNSIISTPSIVLLHKRRKSCQNIIISPSQYNNVEVVVYVYTNIDTTFFFYYCVGSTSTTYLTRASGWHCSDGYVSIRSDMESGHMGLGPYSPRPPLMLWCERTNLFVLVILSSISHSLFIYILF